LEVSSISTALLFPSFGGFGFACGAFIGGFTAVCAVQTDDIDKVNQKVKVKIIKPLHFIIILSKLNDKQSF
jgi:hypothetical protein